MRLFTRQDFQADTCETRFDPLGRAWRATGDSVFEKECSETGACFDGEMRANDRSMLEKGAGLDRRLRVGKRSLPAIGAGLVGAIRGSSRRPGGAFRKYCGSYSTILLVSTRSFSFGSICCISSSVRIPEISLVLS